MHHELLTQHALFVLESRQKGHAGSAFPIISPLIKGSSSFPSPHRHLVVGAVDWWKDPLPNIHQFTSPG